MTTTYIRAGWILTMAENTEPIKDGLLKVVDDKIVSVGPWEGEVDDPSAEFIEAQDRLVLPGLVNTHTHAAMTLFRGLADDLPLISWLKEKIWPMEEKLTPEDVYYGTRLAIDEMLLSGTTTFADMYFFMDQVAEAVKETGIRAVLSRGLTGLSSEASSGLEEALELVKKWKGKADDRITMMLGPHAPYTCPPGFLKEVVTAARHYQLSIMIHVAETEDELAQIAKEYGKRPVAYLAEHGVFSRPVLVAHGVWLDEVELSYLSRQKVAVAHNPSSNMKLAAGIAPVEKMLSAKLLVGLGTDGAASNNRLDMFTEMRMAALLQKAHTGNPSVLPAETVLKMATINGAKALGLGDLIGSLEPGKKADLIMIDLQKSHLTPCFNPQSLVVYSARGGDVSEVMVNGEWLVKNGTLVGRDRQEMILAANKVARRLTGSPA